MTSFPTFSCFFCKYLTVRILLPVIQTCLPEPRDHIPYSLNFYHQIIYLVTGLVAFSWIIFRKLGYIYICMLLFFRNLKCLNFMYFLISRFGKIVLSGRILPADSWSKFHGLQLKNIRKTFIHFAFVINQNTFRATAFLSRTKLIQPNKQVPYWFMYQHNNHVFY